MTELPPLAPLEIVDMPLSYVFKVAGPPVVLWLLLQQIDESHLAIRFLQNMVVFLGVWFVQGRMLRTVDGVSVFREAFRIRGIPELPDWYWSNTSYQHCLCCH